MRRTLHFFIFAAMLVCAAPCFAADKADLVIVRKKERKLLLYNNGEQLASLKVTFGANPEGHKQQQGDERTPEGEYVLDYKNSNSKFYKSIHVSYPNKEDRKAAAERKVSPGGDIMIHGQPNGKGWAAPVLQFFNWTDGCIALKNSDMDLVWNAVDAGTPIVIKP